MPNSSSFIHDDFLLNNQYSIELYHDYACKLPILDYHNHLPPEKIANDYQFQNITELWLEGDHYKWRAMRQLGVDEAFITGSASAKEKFLKWAACVPKLIRNPLYHWTHLELKRYFDIDSPLNADNAGDIYEIATAALQSPSYSCRQLISRMNVAAICTTEDPVDSLKYHKQLKSNSQFITSTAFRPDKSIAIEDPEFANYIQKLSEVTNISIHSFKELKEALSKRISFFDTMGCVLSDHGLSHIPVARVDEITANEALVKRLLGETPPDLDINTYKITLLYFLSKSYHENNWAQQFHLGALRNNSKQLEDLLGKDCGSDSIGDFSQAQGLSSYLNMLDEKNKLTKTILYNLNPSDNEVFATMTGNFHPRGVAGKLQFGASWWFLDQIDGMSKQIDTLSNMGVLSTFVGMLTDSRSFMSFPRHEYFRRLLCQIIGNDIEMGLLPTDIKHLGSIISDICYHNANAFFKFS
jgi:glucuronate isomerase